MTFIRCDRCKNEIKEQVFTPDLPKKTNGLKKDYLKADAFKFRKYDLCERCHIEYCTLIHREFWKRGSHEYNC